MPATTSQLSNPLDDGTGRLSKRAWGALLVLCGALFLDALDVSMVGVALPSIRSDLHLSTSSLQWVVSAYVLGYGGFLLLGGRAADLLGRRRVFLISLGVFVVASLLGGFAHDGNLLIATRFIKGMSAAFTAPAGLSIITTTFKEGPARNKALSVYTATGATGFSLGLVIGGLLTEAGWRWVFFLPAPVALIALIAGIKLVPDQRARLAHRARVRRHRRGHDHGRHAAARLHAGRCTERGLGIAAHDLASFVGAAAFLTAFVIREQRTPTPLVRLGILRSAALVRANLAAMALFGSWIGFQFIATLYMQQLRGWSALDTGLAIFPAGLLVARLLDAHRTARHALRRHAADPRGHGLDRRRLPALPADRAAVGLPGLAAADLPARRPGLRARVRAAQHRRHQRRRARGAGASPADCSTRPSSSAARSRSPSRRP